MSRIDIRSIRRRQIIQAAEELAAQRGWAETTIADICKKADISVGGLTHHFKDKDEILFAVLEDVIQRLHARFKETQPEEGTPRSLNHFFQALCQSVDADRSLYLLLLHFASSSIHRPDIGERLRDFFASLRQRDRDRCQEEAHQEEAQLQGSQAMVDLLHCLGLGLIFGYVFLEVKTPPEQMEAEVRKVLQTYVPDHPHAQEQP
ncbi:TetR/AcrR family transcriptional regulator [Ktedonobacter racemifer]|uniref:Transcriptional regulator, TetR family n=1 Tax=Ktedonobacter racemifer DSM 44963 TaxID=485913 RepID=D6TFB6_KTERA|nr:TetR/AcrR family transcriptional regulator [Ktedonobacter racemifer]EFH88596.1 transcriptional regulator, TetR family [Ktedonobacter racemifer DSM 44963]